MEETPWYIKTAMKCKERGDYRMIREQLTDEDYLERYYLHSRIWTLGLFKVVLHKFLCSDPRELHDHPWLFWGTYILQGTYIEHLSDKKIVKSPGFMGMYTGWRAHRIELEKNKDGKENPVWTLFLIGPKVRVWGFITKKGWVSFTKFLNQIKT